MKKIIALAALLALFAGCKKEEKASDLLVGYWNLAYYDEVITPKPNFPRPAIVIPKQTYHFNSDGSFTFSTNSADSDSGTWAVSNSKLKMIGTEMEYEYDIASISKSSLVLTETRFFDKEGITFKEVDTYTFEKLE